LKEDFNIKEYTNKLTPLMQQYWNIKNNYQDVILFFRLGDFYEVFANDALKIAPILNIVLTKRAGTPMCGVPCRSVNSYIKKLINIGLRVAVCEQLENSYSTKGIVKRGVTKIITPGMIIDDVFLEAKDNNFLMALTCEKKMAYITYAVADISTGDFFSSKISVELAKSEILKYEPKEFVISDNNTLIDSFLFKLKIPISKIENTFFDFENAKNEIINSFGFNSLKKFSLEDVDMICVCGALLSYIRKTQLYSGTKIFYNINCINSSDFMYLDNGTIKNLELFNSLTSEDKSNTLFSTLNSTKTYMGSRMLRKWISRPLLNISKIVRRQKFIRFFIENAELRNKTIKKLKDISDIERLIARVISNNVTPKDLIALKNSLILINSIFKNISFIKNSNYEFDTEINSNIILINKIALYLYETPNLYIKDGGVIKNGINDELDEFRTSLRKIRNHLIKFETKERKITGINNLKVGYTSVFGYYLEVSKSNIKFVPKHYIRKQTIVNGERYITEELKSIEEKILFYNDKIFKLEKNIFDNLVKKISSLAKNILNTAKKIAEIDIFCNFAIDALRYNYICPVLLDNKRLNIIEGRHPVVERILKKGEFTTNDISFNTNQKIIILTGPNMSGKSTYMRQIAIIVLMAQIGSFVPVNKKAEIGIVDRIFTRMGSIDNIVEGESTFMREMIEIAIIMNQYTKKSLIILDEVGRGTSNYDGIAIAQSIVEFFSKEDLKKNDGVKILFATHYFELTTLNRHFKKIGNYKIDVKEWNDNIIFLHKVIKGSTNKSYGIYVAKIAGVPEEIIKRASVILHNLKINSIN
jgi:DNA mismatch repair protein MutS